MYNDVSLFLNGQWLPSSTGRALPILNPATGAVLAQVSHASIEDLDCALDAAEHGFKTWRKVSAIERGQVLRRAAAIVRSRVDDIAPLMTQEQGKPLSEARAETLSAADTMEWFAEEARRIYGRVIPARFSGITQMSLREPVGPVAAFTPWNFPISQAARKLSAAVAAGCSVILKGPEEAPASCAELVRCYADAGLPPGVINLVFGTPAEIANHLIPDSRIRKVTFTGSTTVGKQLAALAGAHMKRTTMELGGHAPVIVCADADVDSAVNLLSIVKFRNAGQACICPSRFLVHEEIYPRFLDAFTTAVRALKVGDGLREETTMGPVANSRRLAAMTELVGNARAVGAGVAVGGNRIGDEGFFFEPTVLVDVPPTADIMNSEPFGPVAAITTFKSLDSAVAEANRLPYGLAAYCFTRSLGTATELASSIESGMISINHFGLALPEVPFGGIKDSGFGSEGGAEALESYLNIKFVTQTGADS